MGKGVVDCLKGLYEGAVTSVQVNGELTGEVEILQGVRQGCPLSPTLYVMYIEGVSRI